VNRQVIIGVLGGGRCTPEISELAEEVGFRIAKRDALLICGGLFGVMEAACIGAKKAGGTTIGVLPGARKSDANEFVDIPLPTAMSDARNIIIVRSSDAVIAINGALGTLSELAFAIKFGVPVVGLETWDIDLRVQKAETAEEAVNKAFGAITNGVMD